MTYQIEAYEFNEGTEEVALYIVLVNGKDGPLFVTWAEAHAWVEAQ